MRVRPMERAILGGEVAELGGGADADADADADEDGVAIDLLLWPKSWANFTSFQMPTEELTMKVDAKVVMPAMAWSILG